MQSSTKGLHLGGKSTAIVIWLVGALLLIAVVIRGLRAPDAVGVGILVAVSLLVPAFTIGIAIAAARRRRTKRLVGVMGKHVRSGTVAFLWPPALNALDRLGWRPTAGSLLSVPVVGISLDETNFSIWEYSSSAPTFTLSTSDVVSVKAGHIFEGLMNRGAIFLEIKSSGRNVRLALNPRTDSHRELTEEQRTRLSLAFRSVVEARSVE
jgi:hypothetical protein